MDEKFFRCKWVLFINFVSRKEELWQVMKMLKVKNGIIEATCKRFSDPLGRSTVLTGSDHYFRTCFRPYVRLLKYRKTKQTSLENNDRYWWDCGPC